MTNHGEGYLNNLFSLFVNKTDGSIDHQNHTCDEDVSGKQRGATTDARSHPTVFLPNPATRLEECFVGPDEDELIVGKSYWGLRCGDHKCIDDEGEKCRTEENPINNIFSDSSIRNEGQKMVMEKELPRRNGNESENCRKRKHTFIDCNGENNNSKGPLAKRKQTDRHTIVTSNTNTSASSLSNAMKTFLSSGCCVIKNALPEEYVAKAKMKVTKDLNFLQQELNRCKEEAVQGNDAHLLTRCIRGDFQELVDRDGGRRDVRFQLDRFPFTSPGLVYNSIVFPLVKELLGGGDVNLLYTGVMWAMPQQHQKGETLTTTTSSLSAKEFASIGAQKWHADGGHLFDHQHLPPHCINVFYPLIDLDESNGPTQVKPGTHILGKLNDPSAKEVSLCCDAGGAILFDYRLNHRGTANFSKERRPILYLCYTKPFFRDFGNSRSGHSIISQSTLRSASSKEERQNIYSPQWVARMLSGEPVTSGEGFELESMIDHEQTSTVNSKTSSTLKNNNNMSVGSGERWILFQMNIELPGSDEPKVLVVHHGDIPLEVSSRFCRENQLGEDFVSVLADSIRAQMVATS